VANGLLLIDQELIIPRLSGKLARRQADMQYGYQKPFRVQFAADQRGALFTAALFDPRSDVMSDVTVIERDAQGLATRRITADAARWDAEAGGWYLTDGLADVRDPGQVAGSLQRQPVAFVATDLDPTALKLRRNASFRQLLSLGQLRELADKPLLVDTASVQRIIHSRFSLIVINLLMLMMVLPFYLLRVPGNLLIQSIKAAPLCLGAWAGGFVILQVDLPGLPPAASAWLPVAIYMPTALVLMDRVKS
jgi:lipopolysaccharide export LptBFGC system permease protein LptF